MKNGIILTGHGKIASGIYSAIQMIAGNFDNLRVCDFKKGDSYDNLDIKLPRTFNLRKYNSPSRHRRGKPFQ